MDVCGVAIGPRSRDWRADLASPFMRKIEPWYAYSELYPRVAYLFLHFQVDFMHHSDVDSEQNPNEALSDLYRAHGLVCISLTVLDDKHASRGD